VERLERYIPSHPA